MIHYGSGDQAPQAEQQKKHGRTFKSHTGDSRTMKRIVLAFDPYRSELVTILAGILLAALLGLVPSLLILHLIDDAIGQGHAGLLLIYVAFMASALILAGLLGVGQSYLSARLGQNVMCDFRNKLYQHLQCMSLSFFIGTRTGEIQSRLTNDIGEIQGTITNIVAGRLSDIIIIISTTITMLIISPLMTLITLALLPLFVWTTYKVGQSQRRMSKETQQSMASLTEQIEESLSINGILLFKVLGQPKYAQAQFQQANKTLGDLTLRQLVIGRVLIAITYTFYSLLPVIIYLIAGEQIIQHVSLPGSAMTLGTMIAFITLQIRLFFPLGELVGLRMEIQGAQALFDRIFEYLDLPIHIADKPDAFHLTPEIVSGEVTFSNVYFTYKRDEYQALTGLNALPLDPSGFGVYNFPVRRLWESRSFLDPLEGTEINEMEKSDNDEAQPLVLPQSVPFPDLQEEGRDLRTANPLWRIGQGQATAPTDPIRPMSLQNITFTIKPGQLVALVGPSGAGKATITYLLSRFYDVDSGEVEIDGINVKDIAQASLSELIGVITRETYLFHGSIRENLLSARQDATEEEMIAAAQTAAIHERIMELYNGYNAIIGGSGYEPSNDEKRRMAIARAFLKNPRILILDEPTSTFDTYSERLIQTALETLRKGRTTLVIAHQLSTLLAADLILVVNEGEIVERGTHQRLLALNGLYARLYREQFSQQSTGITHDSPGTLPKTTAGTFPNTTSIYHDMTENLPKTTAATIRNTTATTASGTPPNTPGMPHDIISTLPKPTVMIVRETPGMLRDTSGMPHNITSALPRTAAVTIRKTPAEDAHDLGTGDRKGRDGLNPSSPLRHFDASEESKSRSVDEGLAPSRPWRSPVAQYASPPKFVSMRTSPIPTAFVHETVPVIETPTANIPPLEVTMQKKIVPPPPKLSLRVATQNDIISTAYLPPSIRGIFGPTTQSEQAAPTEKPIKDTI